MLLYGALPSSPISAIKSVAAWLTMSACACFRAFFVSGLTNGDLAWMGRIFAGLKGGMIELVDKR
jgi:hypothetical protein